MNINDEGLQIIMHYEGFSSEPYKCPADVWTIGYGSTRYPDGSPVSADAVAISEETAVEWLLGELEENEKQVGWLISSELNENQFSALCSFVYNLGSGNLQSSTLRSKLNRSDYEGAADEFPKWRMAGGRVLQGLVRRRADEHRLFLS